MKNNLETIIISCLMTEHNQPPATPEELEQFEHQLHELYRNVAFLNHQAGGIEGNPELMAKLQVYLARVNELTNRLMGELQQRP